MKTALREKPAVDRFAIAIKQADAKPTLRVDREGGRYNAGVIRGVSLCSRGEALGHYMWCDGVFLDQITAAAKSNQKLLKSRFTHPDWCSDGMGKALGTLENFDRSGDQVFGDLHFYEAAHKAPDGDLAAYVMKLAEEDPANFGLSIVFSHDWDAEDEFHDENTKDIELKDESGKVTETRRQFVSPDDKNTENLPHARLSELRACDVVDDPAANPSGLFHRQNPMLSQATDLFDFVVGKSKAAPALSAFGADIAPDRVREFFNNYLASSGLSLVKKESAMAKNQTQLEDKPADESEKKTEPEKMPEEKAESEPEKKDEEEPEMMPEKKDEEQSEKSDLAKFCEVFGHEAGAKYMLEGITFEAAQTKHIAALTSQIKEANEKLAAFASSGVDPVPFSALKDKGRDKNNSEAANSHDSSQANRDKFAASIATSQN